MKKYKGYIILLLMLTLLGCLCYLLKEPMIVLVNNPSLLQEAGILGVFILTFAIIMQIIFAFIPGEPLEVLAGLMYGPIAGTLICIVASAIGSIFVFGLTKKFGVPLVEKMFSQNKLENMPFLQNQKRLFSLLFLIFLLPGTPKDLLTYVMPLTKLTKKEFIFITTFARIPSIIGSTIGGGFVAQEKYLYALLTFAISMVISLVGMKIYQMQTQNKQAL